MKKLVKEFLNESFGSEPEYMGKFESLCQEAANDGIKFEDLKSIIDDALDRIDWDYAQSEVDHRHYRDGFEEDDI